MTSQYKRINGRMVPINTQTVYKSAAQIQQELNAVKEVQIDVDVTKAGAVDWKAAGTKAWRTALQAGLGTLTAALPTTFVAVHDLSAAAAAGVSLTVSSTVASLAAGFAVIQNALEDKGVIKNRKA
jgi:hypothetical protein